MPFKYRKRTNKRMYRRRPAKKGWMQKPLGWYAHKAYQGVRFLKGLVNVEKKFINTVISDSPGTTPAIGALNIIAQGTSDVTRTGDSLLPKYLSVTEKIQIDGSMVGTDIVRIAYILDKENRGAAPAYTDIFDGLTTTARLNMENLDRFVVLKDNLFAMSPGQRPAIARKFTIKTPFHMKYSGNAGDITDLRQNAIFRVVFCEENTNKTALYTQARIAFYDN